MSMRRKRIPLQGISNFRKTQSQSNIKSKNSQIQKAVFNNPIDDAIKNEKKTKNIKSDKSDIENKKYQIRLSEITDNNSLTQIRKSFKNKSNVWRMAKSWKLSKQGFITQQQFQTQMQNLLGIKFNKQQYKQIVDKFSNCQRKIDTENFFKIIFGESKSFGYKPLLFNINQFHTKRSQKINNLVDQLEIYQHAFQKRSHNKQQTNNIEVKSRKQKTVQDSENKQKINRQTPNRVKSQTLTNQCFNKEQFYRLTQTTFSKLKNNFKQNKQFDPKSMLNQNQSKTRFGATCNVTKNQWFSTGNNENNFEKYQKVGCLNSLSLIEKENKRNKLQARISKIREVQNMQKENVNRSEAKHLQKQNARILRKRLDKEAYQYTSYIKNQWK